MAETPDKMPLAKKPRIYALAERWEVGTGVIIAACKELGIEGIRNQLSAIDEEQAERVRVHLNIAAKPKPISLPDPSITSSGNGKQIEEEITALQSQIEEAESERAAWRSIVDLLQAEKQLCEQVAIFINDSLENASKKLAAKSSYEQKKQALASAVKMLKRYGLYIKHPESQKPCNLLCIYDIWGGKFVLAERGTEKRSKTTRNLADLLPVEVMWPDD